MSTLRYDPTTCDWVIFAPSRNLRPHDIGAAAATTALTSQGTNCPFCPGNEALTPPEIDAVREEANNVRSWRVRVVANKFPALRIEEDPQRIVDAHDFHSMGGCGAHEVIVESPSHTLALAQQPVDQIECLLRVLQRRCIDLMGDSRFQTVVIFKNHGIAAGTSLAHPHWQLIATAVVPRLLRVKHFEASAYFDRTGMCLYRDMVDRELAAGKRIVAVNDAYVAFMPYASHSPFETWILPRRNEASFTLVDSRCMHSLAALLKTVLLKLHTGLGDPAFNLTINGVPRGDEEKSYFLWHIRIVPRLTTPAGFELGSGMAINSVLPEDAVAFLGEVPVANHLTNEHA